MLLDRLCWGEEVEGWSCPVSLGTAVDELAGRVDMMGLVGGCELMVVRVEEVVLEVREVMLEVVVLEGRMG